MKKKRPKPKRYEEKIHIQKRKKNGPKHIKICSISLNVKENEN